MKIKKDLVIAITAYNRATALELLFCSLAQIDTNYNVDLIISIDNNGTPDVNLAAERFVWSKGEKKVIVHKEKLGLRKHFLWIGDLTTQYKTVIFLEDDLYVSPNIVDAVCEISKIYREDKRITGISLYSPLICEFSNTRFYPVDDGSDFFFLQHPYWGTVWFDDQWKDFREWFGSYKFDASLLPLNVACWPDSSFKKVYIQYMIQNHKYMVYPRASLVSNMGIQGLHNETDYFQYRTDLLIAKRKYSYITLDEAVAVYDAHFEILPEKIKKVNKKFKNYEFETNLRGLKNVKAPYMLTFCDNDVFELQYTNKFKAMEESILLDCSESVSKYGIKLICSENYKRNERVKTDYRAFDIEKNNILDIKIVLKLLHIYVDRKISSLMRRISKR